MDKQEMAPNEPKATERNITAYNTLGSCETTFKSKARTFKELKADLSANGIPYDNMKILVGETQQDLVEDDEVLNMQELSLFLTPIKVKSGK